MRIASVAISSLKELWHFVSPHINVNTMSLMIAVIAAYISFMALDEAVKQRESMYKPELFMGTLNFCAVIRDSHCIEYYSVEADTVSRQAVDRPWYRLYNVGMGSALSVFGHLKFDTESLQTYFLANRLSGVKVITGNDIIDTLVYRNDTIVVFNKGRVSDWTVDYVLPESQKETESRQFFPPIVMDDIVKAYMWVHAGCGGEGSIDFKVPIELGYKDINGKWYKKTFELSINCSLFDERKNAVICIIRSGSSHEDFIRELEEEAKSNRIHDYYYGSKRNF